MRTSEPSEAINHDRRQLLSTAAMSIAVAGAASPASHASGHRGQGDAIRPFRINVPEEPLVDLRRRIAATRWPERETVTDESQGVQLATIQKLARYWETELRLAQGRGEAERLAAFHDRDRRARHSFHSRSFET